MASQGSAAGAVAAVPLQPHGVDVWLREHPAAVVAAVGEDGRPVPMPREIPLLPSHRVDDRSLLELVRAEDCSRVVSAFLQAMEIGAAVAEVCLAGETGQPVALHYLDVRQRYGVLLRAVVPARPPSAEEATAVIPAARPRLAVMRKEGNSRIAGIDEAVTTLLGWSGEEMIGRQTLDFIHPDDHARAIDNWMQMVAGGRAHSVRLRYRRRDGGWLWMETSNHRDVGGADAPAVTCQLIDISQEMAAVEALDRNERLLRRLIETIPVGLAQIDAQGTVTFANPAARALVADYAVSSLADLRGVLSPSEWAALDAAIGSVLGGGDDVELDVRLLGSARAADRLCRIAVRGVAEAGGLGALLCVTDVTELKAQAVTDPLTRAHNRTAILDTLRRRLADGGPVAVVFLDLDRFKPVNDRFGHEAGDRLLREVTEALRGALRDGDEVGRVGGDEFLVVCPGLADAEAALAVARRLRRRLRHEVRMPTARWSCTASVGVAWVDGRQVGAEEAVARADAAMYAAKRSADGEPVLWSEPVAS